MADALILTFVFICLALVIFRCVRNFKAKKSSCCGCKSCGVSEFCSKDEKKE